MTMELMCLLSVVQLKFLLCFLLTTFFAIAKPAKDVGLSSMRTIAAECRLETGATEADFQEMAQKQPAKSMAAKCLRACLMKKFNLMDSNGKFNEAVALQLIGQISPNNDDKYKNAANITSICYNMEVSENHCEAAEQYKNCASKKVTARSVNINEGLETVGLMLEIDSLLRKRRRSTPNRYRKRG